MNKKGIASVLVIILVIAVGVISLGSWYYVTHQSQSPTISTSEPNPTSTTSGVSSTVPTFVPLAQLPSAPDFAPSLTTSTDIKVDSNYEVGDPNTNSGYFSIPSSSNLANIPYGNRNGFEIFKSVESHAYQGTPIYITNESKEYTLSYIGFKMSDRTLISKFEVEMGIDYIGSPPFSEKAAPLFASLAGIKPACACGPGLYLRRVGNSSLTFVEESQGVDWYSMDTPISLYNLPSHYCDDPNDEYCGVAINGLGQGNLRMHIYYTPNDKSGTFQLQLADLLFKDKNGNFIEPGAWNNFSNYYRANFQ